MVVVPLAVVEECLHQLVDVADSEDDDIELGEDEQHPLSPWLCEIPAKIVQTSLHRSHYTSKLDQITLIGIDMGVSSISCHQTHGQGHAALIPNMMNGNWKARIGPESYGFQNLLLY
ncbi:hypothetical protein FNV43_RR08233 [Rhamnella rubrinervis]|uniref:Uncharacterized protein n=1 Tax=Rhamnella rubrinervis TaxID=2594499 RepID=A0A8K0MMW7_9ROSA|nr:hypothetical protein FNV43_RR08233 [Rhamnella rubrinervis]